MVSLALTPDGRPLDRDVALAGLRSFWYDIALSSSKEPVEALLSFVGADRILFGSDWPYAPRGTSQYFAELYAGLDLDPETRRRIEGLNAERLIPGLHS